MTRTTESGLAVARDAFDPFGTFKPFKRATVTACAVGSCTQLFFTNRLTIEGRHHLEGLDKNRVLFVMNHQTYFMDMIGFYWVVSSPNPFHRLPWIYFVADRKTMERNMITRQVFKLAGCVSIKRTWKEGKQVIRRTVDPKDQSAIGRAINDGWVVTFPQGTTQPFAPVRKGTAHIIRTYNPTVVPVVIDGFGEAFSKGGLIPRKRGVKLNIRVKAPLDLDPDDAIENITAQIADAIEQSDRYRPEAEREEDAS